MPAISASSEPRLAIAAPIRTTGTDHAAPAARTAAAIGRVALREHGRAGGGERRHADDEIEDDGDPEREWDRARNRRARGRAPPRRASRCARSPRTRRREGPQPGARRRRRRARTRCRCATTTCWPPNAIAPTTTASATSDAGDQHARQPRGARDAAQVRAREHRDRGERRGAPAPLRPGNDVRAERDRHRRARRRLADDEPEPGEEPPPLAETLAAVDVRPARRRVLRRELRRRDRVAVRDARGEQQPDQQAAARPPPRPARTPRRRPRRSSSRAR